jgi:hypothetical protein
MMIDCTDRRRKHRDSGIDEVGVTVTESVRQ